MTDGLVIGGKLRSSILGQYPDVIWVNGKREKKITKRQIKRKQREKKCVLSILMYMWTIKEVHIIGVLSPPSVNVCKYRLGQIYFERLS